MMKRLVRQRQEEKPEGLEGKVFIVRTRFLDLQFFNLVIVTRRREIFLRRIWRIPEERGRGRGRETERERVGEREGERVRQRERNNIPRIAKKVR